MASWLDVYSEGGGGRNTPFPTSEAEARRAATAAWLDIYADEEPINYAERFLDTVSPILAPVFDFLSRGQYASANVAEELLRGNFAGIPSAFLQGITGERKGSYIDIAHERLPESWPDWLKSAIGFAGDVLLDPTTYIGVGAVTKTGGRSLLSVAGHGLDELPGILGRAGRALDDRVFGGIEKRSEERRVGKEGTRGERAAERGKVGRRG